MLPILRKCLKHKHLPAKPAKTGAKNHNVLDVLIYAGIRLTNYHNSSTGRRISKMRRVAGVGGGVLQHGVNRRRHGGGPD